MAVLVNKCLVVGRSLVVMELIIYYCHVVIVLSSIDTPTIEVLPDTQVDHAVLLTLVCYLVTVAHLQAD